MIALLIAGVAAGMVLAVVCCVEGWVGRAVHAYDRRTDALRDVGVARINAERSLFYDGLKAWKAGERRHP